MGNNVAVKGDFKQEIFNEVNENVRALERLFPSVVKDGQVDFEALKEELGQFEEVGPEKYGLTWSGKQNAKKIAQEDIVGRTLKFVPQDSKNPDTTENLYIEGDNLEVLKLLRQNYYGAIKMIYIDPPYNTGNDFVYNDDFSMDKAKSDIVEGVASELGERYTVNFKSTNKYHANWINMMYPRLKVAKDLLTDDGVIFISIDDNESDNLKKICNEIFGENNFVACIANINNPKGRSDDKYFATAHEYIYVFQKGFLKLSGFEPEENILRRYNKIDENGDKYREIDLRKTGDNDRKEDRPNLFYYFYYNTKNNDLIASHGDKTIDGYVKIYPTKKDGTLGNWRWQIDTSMANKHLLIPKYSEVSGKWMIYVKDLLSDDLKIKPTTTWTFKDVNSERGTEQFINLGFSKTIFPKPKPIGTLYRLLKISTQSNDIVLDFFAGSSTTAEAVMRLNAEDNEKRKLIMIQLPEEIDSKEEAFKAGYKNICEIGKERIRRAGEKIKEENKEKEGIEDLDIGFKVFRVGDTNIRWNYESDDLKTLNSFINSQADEASKSRDYIAASKQITVEEGALSPKDSLDFMPGFKDIDVVYEILLRQRDIPLSAKVERLEYIGNRTYIFDDSYLVCLEENITNELIEKVSGINPLPIKFVFRDSAFEDDIALKDETIRRLNALIARNTGEDKKSYTVEFI